MANIMELINKKAPIYISNVSGSTVLLELHRPGHDTKPLMTKIPPIKKYPIPFGTIIPYNILEHDVASLHTWINKGVFHLYEPDEAAAIYAREPEMQDTVVKLVNDANTHVPFQPKDIGLRTQPGAMEQAKQEMGKVNYEGEGGQLNAYKKIRRGSMRGSPEEAEVFQLAADSHGVPPKVQAMIISLQEDESLKSEVLMKLRVMSEDELPNNALHFILDNAGTIEGIRKWAKGELSRRQGD
jgi:hypothetical protein